MSTETKPKAKKVTLISRVPSLLLNIVPPQEEWTDGMKRKSVEFRENKAEIPEDLVEWVKGLKDYGYGFILKDEFDQRQKKPKNQDERIWVQGFIRDMDRHRNTMGLPSVVEQTVNI